MDAYKLEEADKNTTVVYGPYEPDYGRQLYGWLVKMSAGKFGAIATNSGVLGTFRTKTLAIDAVTSWAKLTLTPASLDEEFENVTAGGKRIEFKRRFSQQRPIRYRRFLFRQWHAPRCDVG